MRGKPIDVNPYWVEYIETKEVTTICKDSNHQKPGTYITSNSGRVLIVKEKQSVVEAALKKV